MRPRESLHIILGYKFRKIGTRNPKSNSNPHHPKDVVITKNNLKRLWKIVLISQI